MSVEGRICIHSVDDNKRKEDGHPDINDHHASTSFSILIFILNLIFPDKRVSCVLEEFFPDIWNGITEIIWPIFVYAIRPCIPDEWWEVSPSSELGCAPPLFPTYQVDWVRPIRHQSWKVMCHGCCVHLFSLVCLFVSDHPSLCCC